MNLRNKNYGAVTFGWNRATTRAIPGPLGMPSYTRRATLLQLVGALALLGILLVPLNFMPSRLGRRYGQAYRQWILWTGADCWSRAHIVQQAAWTFSSGPVAAGWHFLLWQYTPRRDFVEVWLPDRPYPRAFKVIVNRMPVANIGTLQLDTPIFVQSTQSAGAGPGYGDWLQSGF